MSNNSGMTLPALLLCGALFAILTTSCKEEAAGHTTDVCAHWEYSGEAGPDHWTDCAANASCGGQVQSPVNITGAVVDSTLQEIAVAHDSSTTTILNNGHTLQWNYNAGSTITVDTTAYELLQFHFHTSSEHTLEGSSFPMEVHLVHRNSASGKLAVIGVFFREGAENPLLQKFIGNLPATKDSTFTSTMKFIASDLLPADRSYYTYPGSLTTPPCSEIVTWLVMKEPIEASKAQIDAMKAIMHTNNRPLQALGARQIRTLR